MCFHYLVRLITHAAITCLKPTREVLLLTFFVNYFFYWTTKKHVSDVIIDIKKIATTLCESRSNNRIARYDENSRNGLKLLDQVFWERCLYFSVTWNKFCDYIWAFQSRKATNGSEILTLKDNQGCNKY